MRNIKFRAWDDEDNKIINWNDLEIEKSIEEDIIQVWKEIDLASASKELNRFELMQYAGFKDKNDIEVYESDIVLFLDNRREELRLGKIIWLHHGWRCFDIALGQRANTMSSASKHFEVIGNIHENPELLK